jgi:mannose-6-phosphate isomerase-like protein (cupin superfamily)
MAIKPERCASSFDFESSRSMAELPITPVARSDEWLNALGPLVRPLTFSSDADDGYCLFKAIVPPGVAVPLHSHPDRETFHILEGQLQGLAGETWRDFGPGETFDVPGDVKHAFQNVTGANVSLIFVTTMRMGRFFRELGRPVSAAPPGPPSPDDLQRFFQLAHSYGYWLGTPDDNAAIGLAL